MRLTRKNLIQKIKENNKVKLKHLNIDGNDCLFEVTFEYKGNDLFYVKTLVSNVEKNDYQKNLIELSKMIYSFQGQNCDLSENVIHEIHGYQIYGYRLNESVLNSFLTALTFKNYELIINKEKNNEDKCIEYIRL